MATDNRTTLNNCSAITGWTGDDTVTVDSTTGQSYEGGSSLSWQASNTTGGEHMYTTSIGGTRDLSDAQVWILMKDNLVQSEANNGVQIVLHDGTNRAGYIVGGYDNTGLALPTFFNSYRLDVTNKPSFTTYAGSEASLNEASITGVGVGTQHLAKANGALDNSWVDRMSFIGNNSYALTIDAGTVGTPETFADVVADDITNGWGLINNPFGKQYALFGSTEWGTPSGTANSYFDDSNFQLFLLGGGLGTGNFLMRTVGNATGTNSVVWASASVTNIGTRAVCDFTDANVDILKFTGVSFTDIGAMTFPVASASNRFVRSCTFNNCDQIDFSTIEVTDCTFNGTTDANGTILLDTTLQTANQTGLSFVSDGTGHAIYITAPGTYALDGWTYSGYGADGTANAVVYNNSGGAVTLNVSGGGDTPTVRNGASATTTINNAVTVQVVASDATDLSALEDAQVYLQAAAGGDLPSGASVTITRSGNTATVTHTSHGMVTGQKVKIRGANQQPYNIIAPITVTGVNTYTYTVAFSPATPATGTITSTAVILDGLTNASGIVQDTGFNFTNNQPVTGRVRRASGAPTGAVGSTSVYRGSFTAPTATGNFSVTGVGFTPKAIRFWGVSRADENLGDHATMFEGYTDGTNDVCCGVRRHGTTTGGTRQSTALNCIEMQRGPDTNDQYKASLVSFDTDGFTLNFGTVFDSSAFIIHYECFGGTGVSATVGQVTHSSGSVTGLSHTPDLVFVTSIVTSGTEVSDSNPRLSCGVFDYNLNQYAWGAHFGNFGGTTTQGGLIRTDGFFVGVNNGALFAVTGVDSITSDGFTFSAVSGSPGTTEYFYLVLTVDTDAQVGDTTKTTATAPTDQSISLNFTPALYGLDCGVETSETIYNGDVHYSKGSRLTGGGRGVGALSSEDGANDAQMIQNNDEIAILLDENGTVLARADANAVTGANIDINWTVNDSNAYIMGFWAIESNAVAGGGIDYYKTSAITGTITSAGFAQNVLLTRDQ